MAISLGWEMRQRKTKRDAQDSNISNGDAQDSNLS